MSKLTKLLLEERIHAFPHGVNEPFWLYDSDISLKSHPKYQEAKAGEAEAAKELVLDLALDFLVSIKDKIPADVTFVAPHAREATGDNAIPQVLATASAIVMHGLVETDIVQVTKVYHTGADPMERMCLRPEFEGAVTPGAQYVLVDDVTNMGGTLAELSNYIQCLGGVVISAIVLVNAGRIKQFQAHSKVTRELERRYPYEIGEIFSVIPSALTLWFDDGWQLSMWSN